jgi:hypothetical protein
MFIAQGNLSKKFKDGWSVDICLNEPFFLCCSVKKSLSKRR